MMRKLGLTLVTGALVMALGMSAQAGAAKTVWTDASGDAGNQDSSVPGGTEGGFDIVKGAIARKGANLEFTVTHAAMPATGTLPEGFRFLWAFTAGKNEYRLTVKSADIGKPDAGTQSGTERIGRADVNGHFRLEGNCVDETPTIKCYPLAYLTGKFDPATKSFTMVVPLKAIKAKPGTVLTASSGPAAQLCPPGICWTTHTAERSLNYSVIDSAAMLTKYVVPKK